MKKQTSVMIGALVVALAVAAPREAAAQTYGVTGPGYENQNLFIFNPGDLINGVVSVEYERALAPFFGLAFGLSVNSFRGVFTPAAHSSYVSIGPEVAARFHFIQAAPAGLWIGPSIQAGYIASRSNSSVSQAIAWGVGAAVGYNFVIARHFVIQLGVGGGFNDYGEGLAWSPRFRLGLGGAW